MSGATRVPPDARRPPQVNLSSQILFNCCSYLATLLCLLFSLSPFVVSGKLQYRSRSNGELLPLRRGAGPEFSAVVRGPTITEEPQESVRTTGGDAPGLLLLPATTSTSVPAAAST